MLDLIHSLILFLSLECNYIYFQDEKGEEVKRVMAFVKDTVEMVKEIKRGRGISKEELVLSADKGQGKLIVTMSIFDADSNGKVHGLKPGSNQRIFLLAMVIKMFFLILFSHPVLRLMIFLSRQ